MKLWYDLCVLTLLFGMWVGGTWTHADEAWQMTAKAWTAMKEKKYDEVVHLADEAIQRWGKQARQTNASLKDYPRGDQVKRFSILNELATITWLKAEALRKKGDRTRAIATYWQLIADFTYGQCWDSHGWWWQPAKAAQKVVEQLQKGIDPDSTPNEAFEQAWQVTAKAWKAWGKKQYDEVIRLAEYAQSHWGKQAREMNSGLHRYPKGKAARQYANLNELATITLLKAQALEKKGQKKEAIAALKQLQTDYTYGQCWDNRGWWWQPAKAAQDLLARLDPSSVKAIELKTPPLPEKLRLPGKRGICFTLRQKGKEGSWEKNLARIKALKPYWNYSWGMERIEQQPANIEFIPMAWGAWNSDNFQKALNKYVVPKIKQGLVKRFLGFNEPDKSDQANMPVDAALKYWPILEKLGIPLCSPACANPLGDDDTSNQGVGGSWMRQFMREAEKRGYRVDYIGVHWYGSPSPTFFKERMLKIYNAYGKRPLLITEFAVADWGVKRPADNKYSEKAVLDFMKNVLPWMEKQNWIAGYAWFSFGKNEAHGTSSALFDEKGNLTACGRYYRSVTNENPEGDQSIVP